MVLAVAVCVAGVAACGGGSGSPSPKQVAGGNSGTGKSAIQRDGCGACHFIPGAPGANAYVGPPLLKFSRRVVIAGMLANPPENLITWIQHPQSVVPGNDMPALNVPDQDARDIAAYLCTLT